MHGVEHAVVNYSSFLQLCNFLDDDEVGFTEGGCPESFFKCNDGKCISSSWKCDGEKDCSDGEDEKECTECNGTAWFCGLKSKKCLSINDVCDGYSDCSEGTDEHDDCGADFNEHHGRYANHRHESIEVDSTMEYHSRGKS